MNGTVTSRYLKKALLRDNTVPAGIAAPMHVECVCGTNVRIETEHNECLKCGTTYSAWGWITRGPKAPMEAI